MSLPCIQLTTKLQRPIYPSFTTHVSLLTVKIINRPDGLHKVFFHIQCACRKILPFEVKAPVESATHKGRCTVIECVRIDDINNWHSNCGARLSNSCQQRLQPVTIHFNVAVQEYQYLQFTCLKWVGTT
jgi:hypothetical protein